MPISFTERTSESIKAIEERNKSLILKTNEEIFNKGNLAFADEVFASFYYNYRGPEYIKDRVSALKTAFPDLWVVVQPVLAEEVWLPGGVIIQGPIRVSIWDFHLRGRKYTGIRLSSVILLIQ